MELYVNFFEFVWEVFFDVGDVVDVVRFRVVDVNRDYFLVKFIIVNYGVNVYGFYWCY